MALFQGLSAFPITPADADGRVDVDALAVLLARLVDAGVDSIGLLGSTGTYAYLSRAERRRAIEAAVEVVGGRVPLLVGIGALRTDEAAALGRDAREAGADAVLLAPVSYTPLTEDEVFVHYEAVARAAGLPLCVYNNPFATHFTFSAGLIGRLSALENVVAIKNPAPVAEALTRAELSDLRSRTGPDFSLGYSIDANCAEAMLAGGDAWYSVLAGLFPQPCQRILQAIDRGDREEARRINASLEPLWALFRELSGLRLVYAAAREMGLCRTDPPRPILPLGPEASRRVRETLEGLELI